jgi:hypothetical protein
MSMPVAACGPVIGPSIATVMLLEELQDPRKTPLVRTAAAMA